MSDKLPEGLIEEIQRHPKLSVLSRMGTSGVIKSMEIGAELFASYIAKQEPAGYRHKFNHGSFLGSIDLIEMKDNWQPLYTHPSHLESENKRLRDALGRIAHISPETGRAGCTYGDTDFDSLSAVKGHNDLLEFVQKIATNAINK